MGEILGVEGKGGEGGEYREVVRHHVSLTRARLRCRVRGRAHTQPVAIVWGQGIGGRGLQVEAEVALGVGVEFRVAWGVGPQHDLLHAVP